MLVSSSLKEFFLFVCLWLRWIFVAASELSLAVNEQSLLSSCSARASRFGGFSRCGARALGHAASVVVVHRLSCLTAGGIFPDRGWNPCPLCWRADS